MRFLVDAQLPPALAQRLGEKGHFAAHVMDVGLDVATDRQIWAYASKRGAVLVTKDGDFADLARTEVQGAAVVWIRLGNTTNRALWRVLEPVLAEIIEGLGRGERLIEVA